MTNMKKRSIVLNMLALLATLPVLAQSTGATQSPGKWAAEVNVLWPIYPGDTYNGKVLYRVCQRPNTSGHVFVGVNHHPKAFREKEGNWSALEATFGYRQFFGKHLHADLYNALGQGRIQRSVVDGRDYNSLDYVVGAFVGYKKAFGKGSVKPYINLQPIGVLFVAYQSDPHPIVGQTSERPGYAGTVQFGIDF